MKKRTIIVSNLLIITILMILPNISAIEYKTANELIQSNIDTKLENIKLEFSIITNNLNTNIDILFTILIKGVILPIIFLTIGNGIALLLGEINPILGMITAFINGLILGAVFIIPIMELIIEKTGSVLLGYIIYVLLAILDIKIAGKISRLIFHG